MTTKKVLHIAHYLPDVRVEKMMLAGKALGFQVEIATETFRKFTFEELNGTPIHYYQASLSDHFGWSNNAGMKLTSIVEEVDPDIIHAHDIYNAHFVSHLNRNLVYDDHEFWSNAIRNDLAHESFLSLKRWRRTVGLFFRRRKIPKWEREIVENSVIITIHERIAFHHRKMNPNVFVVENYPHSLEIYDIPSVDRDPRLGAYIGRDMGTLGNQYRNTRDFYLLVKRTPDVKMKIIGDTKVPTEGNIISLGYIDHKDILKSLADCTFGFGPWKPHESHQYSSANKLHLYAHAGLHIIIPYTLSYHSFFSYSYFKTYDDIIEIIRNPPRIDPEEIISHAREHLLFDIRYNRIKTAYEKALE